MCNAFKISDAKIASRKNLIIEYKVELKRGWRSCIAPPSFTYLLFISMASRLLPTVHPGIDELDTLALVAEAEGFPAAILAVRYGLGIR